jgi:RNA polymerase sigma factor (sigma-70 family)
VDNQNSKYREIVSLVIQKFAKGIPRQDKDDLWQEAELALFSAKKELEKHPAPERLAYKIIRSCVVNVLRKNPPRAEDISDPNVIRKVDKQTIVYPTTDIKLDAEKAVHLVNQLPATEKFVLIMTFGLEDNPKFTERELATLMKKPEVWVYRTKKKALIKLRAMIERKQL